MGKTEPNWPVEVERALQVAGQTDYGAQQYAQHDPYAPKRHLADLRALERDIMAPPRPLHDVAVTISGLKFHDLMAMASAITGIGVDQPYTLAAALSAWALKETAEPEAEALR